jgi:hypothetical protein
LAWFGFGFVWLGLVWFGLFGFPSRDINVLLQD